MPRHTKTNSDNGWEVVVARDFEQIEAIRELWQKMQYLQPDPAPNSDINGYLAVLSAQKDEMQPYVMLFVREKVPVGMVIGRIEMRQLRCRIGYKVVYKPLLRSLTIVYGGILGEQNEAFCAKIIAELQLILRSGEVDMVHLSLLQTDSLLFRMARKRTNLLCRDYVSVVCPHWQTQIPDTMEVFYKGLSTHRRRYVKYYTKKLQKECLGQLKLACYREEDDLDYIIETAAKISSSTYKDALGVGFVDDPVTRSLLQQAAKDGSLRAYVLYANSEPCAFEYGVKYGETFFAQYMGFDPKWKAASPGTVLWIKVIEDLSGDAEVHLLDYGFGHTAYKERFGQKKWLEASASIFAPRVYPIFVNLVQSLIWATYILFNWLSTKTGVNQWVKRFWRDRLQKKTKCTKHRVGR